MNDTEEISTAGELRPVTAREVWESGLLWRINEAVLWPLGLCLTVDVDVDDRDDAGHMFVQATQPYEPIISAADKGEQAEQADRFAAWLKGRMGR